MKSQSSIGGCTTDENKVKNAVAPTQKALQAIESLTVGSPYLLGSKVTIADLYLIAIFIYLQQTPEFDTVTTQTPKLKNWWDEVSKLASVKKVCA
ncbi:hypothetical protein NIES4071_99000 [Calothrix sp. NIES-4071]|nr:hypothetical protein NIES4071_99000 [Calothrix sp. NIES-4071]BAZ64163.1 hypothetical protein NIES4105_98930 [Calothrix sp. NIES-4105]